MIASGPDPQVGRGAETARKPTPPNASGPNPQPFVRRRRRRERSWRMMALKWIGTAAGILLAAQWIWSADRLRPLLESTLKERLGRTVHVGSLRYSIGFGQLVARKLTVEEDPAFGKEPFLRAARVNFSIHRFAALTGGRVEVTNVELDAPEIRFLRRGGDGRWNFESVLASFAAEGLETPAALQIRRGVLSAGSTQGILTTLQNLTLELDDVRSGVESPFALSAVATGGGRINLHGKAGPVTSRQGVVEFPFSALADIRKVNLGASRIGAAISPVLGGVVSFDGSIESDGRRIDVAGHSRIGGLTLAKGAAADEQTHDIGLAIQHDLATHTGTVTRCELTVPKGSAEMNGQYTVLESGVAAKLHFSGRGVPAQHMLSLLRATGISLPTGSSLQGGLAFVEMEMEGSLDNPKTTGSLSLSLARLAGFPWQEALPGLAPEDRTLNDPEFEISSMSMNFRASPDGIEVPQFEARLAGVGLLAGSGTIARDHSLDFHLKGEPEGPRRAVSVRVRGSCASPALAQADGPG